MQRMPATIDEYLSCLDEPKKTALERLRKTIKAIAPTARECISYGVPTFKLNGKMLVSFGAAAKHCALYPGAYPIASCKDDLAAYDTSKGTVRFPTDKPLPATLVRKLVKARLAQRTRQS
jgi:uncharacterized protein YdhG (YjbR/CyaY superfamily)